MPEPKHLVVAEDVSDGKPAPECYVLGMKRLGLQAANQILVVEDSTSGVQAGKVAGCKVLGLVTTHTIDQLYAAGADWIVHDLTDVVLAENSSRTSSCTGDDSTAVKIDIEIWNNLLPSR